ncbi:hypothetical protein C2G38_2141883 [Gigaspora rosea]|uniref:F-box domain-containing protein n=1 Tax=Gigaspora rosea TaxID=44941 RepID=A0A397VAE4_9GLOM|nr:hypothetical protein C2G38_2141883 [Gigaspora rosea]
MAKEFKSINFINFPNREEELDDIIYCMTFLMDLTGFINVTDSGVTHLAGAKSQEIKNLDVGYTRITDKGVKELGGLPHLSFLNFDFTQVSLSCRNILADIPSLQPVRLNGITKEICEDEYYDI